MTTVILGGTGRTGSRILDRLTAAAHPVRPASRRTGFDWDDTSTWRGALRGATAAYVCFTYGRLRLPAPDVPEAFVDLDDVADAAVVALTRAVPEDATYELSGPELLTFAQSAALISAVSGRTVTFEAVDVPSFVRDIAVDGVPAEEAEPLAHLFTDILDGRNAFLADGIERLLGRPASPFRRYVRRAAASGAWS